MAAVSETGHDSELRSSSIGLADVLFQAMTYMAPGVGLAFSIGIAVGISGATLPLSVIVALIACTFCAISIGQMATRIPSAGGLYTYAAKGIGPKTGFLVGWFYVAFGVFLPGSLLTLGGWFVNGFLEREIGSGIAVGWWLWGIIFAICIFMLTYFDVRVSAKATIVLGAIEIGVFFALAVTMVASEPNSTKPFTPSSGADGWGGIFQGAVFAILAFIGFEAASALGEEAKNPKKVIPQGVIGSCVIVGLFYVFQTYAWNVGAGVGTTGDTAIIDHYTETGGSAWDALGGQFWGGSVGAWILFFALVNSVIACGTAATNNAARVFFAMGRSGSAPAWLGKVHPRHKSPYMSVITTLVVTGVVAYAAAIIFGDALGPGTAGLVGFIAEATFFTVIAIIIYMIASASCLNYFSRKEGKPEQKVLMHVVVPIIGIAAFILPLYTQYFNLSQLFNGTLFEWAYKNADTGANIFLGRDAPGVTAVMGALIWVIVGIALSWYLGATRPEVLERATHVFGGEVDDDTPHGHADSMSITH